MMLRVVIMGVSGCGKSMVGKALSEWLGIAYLDGDDLHPEANVRKMRSGTPLTDGDRWPWLDAVAAALADRAPAIVGCSALKWAYRDRIRAGAGGPVRFVHLAGSRDLIARRMAARKHHFMPLSLLDTQFATLEAPDAAEALTLDIALPVSALLEAITADLKETMR